jgi:hypothetical protein
MMLSRCHKAHIILVNTENGEYLACEVCGCATSGTMTVACFEDIIELSTDKESNNVTD